MEHDKVIKYLPDVKNYNPMFEGTNIGIIIDTETTSPDPKTCRILEVSLIPFTFTDELEICEVKPTVTMYNDPGFEISEEITKLTGITNEMVEGKRIDVDLLKKILSKAEIVIAHGAKFDRQVLENNLDIPDVMWGCSMMDIDWKKKMISSKALDYIAFRRGFWFEGHQGHEDCRALIHILGAIIEGENLFAELMTKVYEPSHRIILRDTKYDENKTIKSGWFRWEPDEKYWYKDGVKESDEDGIRENVINKLSSCTATKIPENPLHRFKWQN